MNITNDFQEILYYAHYWNWAPDWLVVKNIYEKIPELLDENGNPKRRKVGLGLIKLAKEENNKNLEYIEKLDKIEKYFENSTDLDSGDNRNSVDHGYMHPRFWTQESFESLIHDIAIMSKYSRF